MSNKPKEIKSYIYPDIYAELAKGEDFENHGLSYAVNAVLAQALGLPTPETPSARKGQGGRKLGVRKNQHTIVLPANWLQLLEGLINGRTWFRKDVPQLARYAEKIGLVEFVQRHGARPTDKLTDILKQNDFGQILGNLFRDELLKMGYRLKMDGPEVKG